MTKKFNLSQIQRFASDPSDLKNKGSNPQFADIFVYFMRAYQKVSEVLRELEEHQRSYVVNGEKVDIYKIQNELVGKYAKNVSVTFYPPAPNAKPNTPPQMVKTHEYEPPSKFDDFQTELQKLEDERTERLNKFSSQEFELDLEACPKEKLPRGAFQRAQEREAYMGFIIEEDSKLTLS